MVLGGIIFASLQILNVAPASILLLLAVFTRLFPRLAAGQSQLQAFLSELPAFENLMTIYRECVANAEVPGAPAPGLPWPMKSAWSGSASATTPSGPWCWRICR